MDRVLIANRGEIACRIIRSCRTAGYSPVVIHSDADAGALHVRLADAARRVGPPPVAESYLDQDAVLGAARELGARFVHPGYGLLSENAGFARRVIGEGLVWVGPDPDTIAAMGDKDRARAIAAAAGVPVLGGSHRLDASDSEGVLAAAHRVGFPLLVKATAGGGGIGMRRVDAPGDLAARAESIGGLAGRIFGDAGIFLERLVPRARHVEVQVIGYGDGRVTHLFDRDCSVQRRYQKVIEEAPAPALDPQIRDALAQAACALAASQRYLGAGTVEFLVDRDTGSFHFLEMNTRLQVEHPVTEMFTGLDIVALQLALADGSAAPGVPEARGHAIECRIYAENPARRFLPSPGTLDRFVLPPLSDGLRIETGYETGDELSRWYDPLIAKLVVHGDDRRAAITGLGKALSAVRIEGVATNLDLLRQVIRDPEFRDGPVDTGYLERALPGLLSTLQSDEPG